MSRDEWLLVKSLAADVGDALALERDPTRRARLAFDLARTTREQLEGLGGLEASAMCSTLRTIEAGLRSVSSETETKVSVR